MLLSRLSSSVYFILHASSNIKRTEGKKNQDRGCTALLRSPLPYTKSSIVWAQCYCCCNSEGIASSCSFCYLLQLIYSRSMFYCYPNDFSFSFFPSLFFFSLSLFCIINPRMPIMENFSEAFKNFKKVLKTKTMRTKLLPCSVAQQILLFGTCLPVSSTSFLKADRMVHSILRGNEGSSLMNDNLPDFMQ